MLRIQFPVVGSDYLSSFSAAALCASFFSSTISPPAFFSLLRCFSLLASSCIFYDCWFLNYNLYFFAFCISASLSESFNGVIAELFTFGTNVVGLVPGSSYNFSIEICWCWRVSNAWIKLGWLFYRRLISLLLAWFCCSPFSSKVMPVCLIFGLRGDLISFNYFICFRCMSAWVSAAFPLRYFIFIFGTLLRSEFTLPLRSWLICAIL